MRYNAPIMVIHTNVYGIARSSIALSLIITIAFTDYELNLLPLLQSNIDSTFVPNFFLIFGEEYILQAIWASILALGLVISGYLPQVTCFLLAWIANSFLGGAILIEGGDQICQILSILLIPVSVTDKRLNHWARKSFFSWSVPYFAKYFAYSSMVMIQIQMSIVYFFAVAEKVKVHEWRTGSAFYYWFYHPTFGASDYLADLIGSFISDSITGPLITWSVLVLEAVLFAALFMSQQNRKRLLLLAIGFHFGIILVHGLVSFFFAMTAGAFVYLFPYNQFISLRWVKKYFHSFSFSPSFFQGVKKRIQITYR